MFTPHFLSLLLIIGLHEHGDTLGLGQDAESHGGQDLAEDEASEMKVRLPVSRQHMQQLRAALNLPVSGAGGPHPPLGRHETLKMARKIMEKSPSSLFGDDKASGSHYSNAEDNKGPIPPLGNNKARGSYYRNAEDNKGPIPPLGNDKAPGSYYRHAEDNKGPIPPLGNDKAPGSYYRHAEDNKGPIPPLSNDKAPGSYYRHAEENKGPIPPLGNDKAPGSYYRHAEDNKGPIPPLGNDKAPGSYYRHAEDNKGPIPPLGNDKAPGSIMASRHTSERSLLPLEVLEKANKGPGRPGGNSVNRPLLPANAGGPPPLKLTLILENKKTETLTDDASDDLEFSIANSKTETLIGLRNPSLPISGQF